MRHIRAHRSDGGAAALTRLHRRHPAAHRRRGRRRDHRPGLGRRRAAGPAYRRGGQVAGVDQMKLESVDFFYLSMPDVLDIGDGSQDALLVHVLSGGFEGWGERDAAPLPSIAAWVCPCSHFACKPVRDSGPGQKLDGVADIERTGDQVRVNNLDLLQADHTLRASISLSGICVGKNSACRSTGCLATRNHARRRPMTRCSSVTRRRPRCNKRVRRKPPAVARRSLAGVPLAALPSRPTASSCRPRARESVQTGCFWWMPARSGWTKWRAPRKPCPPCANAARSGSRSPSSRARLTPNSPLPTKPAHSNSPAVNARTTSGWRGR